jgi:hypothetical protein
MRIEETLRKAAGLFMELPDPEPKEVKPWNVMDTPPSKPVQPVQPSKTVEQVVRDAPGPNLDEIKPAAVSANIQPVDAQGNVDFIAIYGLANLPTSPFSAEQVLELLATLPAELPLEAKRATVKVTINAMAKATGVTPDAIVADASRKLAALAAYAKSYADQAGQYVSKAEAEIAALQAEILQRTSAIADAKQKQAQMISACTSESDRLDDVLEFFSLDVHPSKYAPEA